MSNARVINIHPLSELQEFDIFSSISIKTLQKYLPYFYYRTYKKNQCLFMEGDPRDKIFFLLEGYVAFERGSEEGKMLYLDIVKSKQMFPYGGIFEEKTYHETATALTDIKVFFIQTTVMEELLKKNPKQLLNIIAKLTKILNLHKDRVEKILIPNAQERVLHTLQFLMDDLGEKKGEEVVIPCPLTAFCISKISGTTRETVSLIMNQLKREGIISIKSKVITIHETEYLRNI
ncbi:Crp/Fnr family transcriptional regulator [Mesobacillus boroniphilus]|uniref:Crp/Fnr family transcriptional regulator n=1 Tax=Mesobacillus boroniphilus TaxID=308892 RepID=A0A944CR57_9BACI|nr:Crp/Fnr family transcriptional regulator [Mesobacillus boroniphilus]MBS8266283.1 Crp/Fnr family transcriptional regulator [Mesobacillus boroniphilus]